MLVGDFSGNLAESFSRKQAHVGDGSTRRHVTTLNEPDTEARALDLCGPGTSMTRQPRDLLDRHSLITHHADERGPQLLRHPS
jgi:hypothetical protein